MRNDDPLLLLVTIDLRHADVAAFEAYEAAVLPLLPQHGGRLVIRVRSTEGGQETHLLSFSNRAGLAEFEANPARQSAAGLWRSCGATSTVTEVRTVGGQPAAGNLIAVGTE